MKVHLQQRDALERLGLEQVDPDHRRLRRALATTWLQPPGATPRSTTRRTPLSRPKRSSSSASL
jgi:hypothetical protein